jgi:putative ABC transport system permease protein
MKLAWQNIVHDRGRFSVTVLGVSFAVFLMVFQGSLLNGFLRAASRLIDASDSQLWITARGVPAFEFGTTLQSRMRELVAGVPGVTETDRVCMAFAVYRTPNGNQQVVALVGADPKTGKRFPIPEITGSALAHEISPDAVFYDVSDRNQIGVSTLPASIEINRHRASIEREIKGYGAFLGVPFLFTSYRNAARYIGFGPEDGMYILARVGNGYSVPEVQTELQRRLPEVDVLRRMSSRESRGHIGPLKPALAEQF